MLRSLFTSLAGILTLPLQQFGPVVPGGYFLQNTLTVGSRQFNNCYSGTGFYDPNLGNFDRYPDLACKPSPCPPETPRMIGTKFLLTTRNRRDYFIRDGDESIRNLFGANKVVIFIHGWTNNYRIDPYMNQTREGWLRRGADYITVDWSQGNADYDASASNIRVIGAQVGRLVDFLRIDNKTECIGFSFGAHACGFAGHWLRTRRGKTLASCTGIDPASKRFEDCPEEMRLDSSDCGVVKVLHSSYLRSLVPTSFGITQKVGNCDFYVRYMSFVEGCPYLDFGNLFNSASSLNPDRVSVIFQYFVACNHVQGMQIYNQQLFSRRPGDRISAVQCSGPVTDCSGILANVTNRMNLPPFDSCSSNDQINMCICT